MADDRETRQEASPSRAMAQEPKKESSDGKQHKKDQVFQWNPQTAELLEDWLTRVTAAQYGHQVKAQFVHRLSLLIGIPVVAFTTIVGTAIWASINHTARDTRLKIIL